MTPAFFKLGGTQYRLITSSTFEHDMATAALVQRHGLDRIDMQPDETAESWARRVTTVGMASGSAADLLSHMLIPDTLTDHQWSPDVATATSTKLKALTDPQDKALARDLFAEALIGFFTAALASSKTTPRSLAEPQLDPSGKTVETTTTATGTT